MEHKQYISPSFKFNDEGSGSFTAVLNKMFYVDDGGDIVIGVERLDEFVRDGFAPDSHGMEGGTPGGYVKGREVAIPTYAGVENEDDIVGTFEFHDTEPAQNLRKVMAKRHKNGKSNKMSIGYDLAQAPLFIPRGSYEKEFPRFIPAKFVPRCIEAAQRFKQVRLIKVILNEGSPVSIPMNRASDVLEVKSANLKIDFTNKGFKAIYLGENIEESLSLTVIDMLHNRLWWFCWQCLYDETTTEAEKMEKIEAALMEYATLSAAIIKRIRESVSDADLGEEIKQKYGTREEPKASPVAIGSARADLDKCVGVAQEMAALMKNLRTTLVLSDPMETTQEISQTKAADLDEFEALELQNLQSINDIRINNHRKQ